LPPKYEIGQVATSIIQDAWQFSFRPIIDIKPSIYPDGGWFYFFEGINSGIHEDDVLLLEEAGEHASGSVWNGTPEEVDITVLTDDASTTNIDKTSHVPPVLTRTWFHTGVYLGRDHISNFFAGLLDEEDVGEYYREPGLTDPQARELLLDDAVLRDDLTIDEEREACRALKGSMLRQEVYALDDTDKAEHPYTVTEQNFTIQRLQPHDGNRYAVFFTHPREAISYHYERNPADPRITHAMTLEVDDFGNVLKEAAIGYGRRETIRVVDDEGGVTEIPNPAWVELDPEDQAKQTQTLITYTENRVTNVIETDDDYRTPLPCETRTYELTGFKPENNAARFSFDEWTRNNFALPTSA
ncbi:MAG: hypothetical protein GY794_13035, partial [bacterium]|nr:hypothetical protein [bacterium]